jgi:hypothetical protein
MPFQGYIHHVEFLNKSHQSVILRLINSEVTIENMRAPRSMFAFQFLFIY